MRGIGGKTFYLSFNSTELISQHMAGNKSSQMAWLAEIQQYYVLLKINKFAPYTTLTNGFLLNLLTSIFARRTVFSSSYKYRK